jgi:hypothetical protein
MAKWVGEGKPPFTGTVDCVTVYQLPDQKWYVRMRSSITAKRIKKDKVFAGFRRSSVRMKDASPIASKVYAQLPVKEFKLFREMTGKALLGLKAGLSVAEITDKLMEEYMPAAKTETKRIPVKSKKLYKIYPRPLKKESKRALQVTLLPVSSHSPPTLRPMYVLYTAHFHSCTHNQINDHHQANQKDKTSQ